MTVLLENPIGRPPFNEYADFENSDIRDMALPVVEILPCVPSFVEGHSLFRAKPCWSTGFGATPAYLELLNSHGYTIEGTCLRLAFLGDSFPTDQLSNEYGESMLDSLAGSVSSTTSDLSQMLGARNFIDALRNVETAGQNANNMAGNIFAKGAGMALSGISGLTDAARGLPGGSMVSQLGTYMGDILSGGRIDFPQLWKGSGFKPSYTMTVRLFNPSPANDELTEKYIIGPLAAILLLATPISLNGSTYNWPFIHKVVCKGMFRLESAYISNITVVKGGDQLQVAFNQRLGIVDVRIEFSSLYNTLISLLDDIDVADRPTLRGYLRELKNRRTSVTEDIPEELTSAGTSTDSNATTGNPQSRINQNVVNATNSFNSEDKNQTSLNSIKTEN